MNLKTCLTIALSLALVGCASQKDAWQVPPDPVYVPVATRIDCGIPEPTSPVKFRPVILGKAEVDGTTVLTLPGPAYENLSWNTSELKRGLKELKATLRFYLDCIDGHNARVSQPGNVQGGSGPGSSP